MNTGQVFLNIGVYTTYWACRARPYERSKRQDNRERLRDCYLNWSTYQNAGRGHRSAMSRKLCDICYSIFSQIPRRF